MKEIESISAALFDKIRSRFPGVTLGDETAKACSDPEKARFFNFTYSDTQGNDFGKVTVSLIDEQSLKVYFGTNISGEMDRDQRKEWYEFLRNLRLFAKRNLMVFDTRDITKSNLELKDVKQQAKVDTVATTDDVTVTESRAYGSSRNSYIDVGECRIMIRHDGMVSDDIHGSRSRNIRDIFIETPIGERLHVGHNNLHGAKALACHISLGGNMHDEIAEHIDQLVTEMSAMKHFVRSTKHRQFEDAETQEMTHAAVHQYDRIKRTLRQMRGARGHRSYFENFMPASPIEDDVDIDNLRERFVKKVFDERLTDALPYVYRAYRQQQECSNYGTELEEWMEAVSESTWAKPDSEDKIMALRELLKTPLPAGIDGIDATTKLEPIIGSDELNDEIEKLASAEGSGPDADVTPLIKKWLVQNMPGLLDQLEIGQDDNRDQQTNWAQPVSPGAAQGATYGSQPTGTNVNNMTYEDTDPLDFIRSLAGLRKQ